MNKKECVIYELYDILEKLRYPEIAQTRFEEFENTILTGSKRIDLLYWLLQESPGFKSLFLNKLKDNTDKLFKCYSQIGLCNDINILLGKCHIDKQLQFFTLLTLFIKNVHLVSTGIQENKQTENILLQTNVENINSNFSTDSQNINGEREMNSNNVMKILRLPNQTNKVHDKYLNELCSHVKENIKEINDQKNDSFEPVLQDFNTAFNKFSSLKTQNTHFNIFSENYDLCSDVQNVHSTILIINKTLINEAKIKNCQIPENSTKIAKPLTLAIKDNIVLNEQARNMISNTLTYN